MPYPPPQNEEVERCRSPFSPLDAPSGGLSCAVGALGGEWAKAEAQGFAERRGMLSLAQTRKERRLVDALLVCF